ncbi:MAG TPA: 4-alpha-glucanotransferase [Burkholderiaceae bacterium]|nr:4-alpha-glucanotransferase [Burkholderiaceae bacterium]
MNFDTRSSGVMLHVTSLPGPHGIGDFGPDAYRFVDWLARAKQRLWQWLPTTPVGPGDSPYQSPSAFAGSPLAVALEPLVERGWLDRIELPREPFPSARVDFRRVIPWREAQLRRAHAGFEARASAGDRQAFEAWCQAEAAWLDEYALFMAIFMAHGMKPWWDWAAPLRQREPKALAQAKRDHAHEIAYWRFVQWCWDEQCRALKRYANERGIALVGDIPIYVADNSADVWSRPDLYELGADGLPTVIAGVPPDDLGPEGQRWGNPIYRWDRMAAEDYAWWTARARRVLAQADIVRIDHFRGFAGYWEIPSSSPTAKVGRWVAGPGLALFQAIEKQLGQLPIIAEDLGLITPDVVQLIDACGFPRMKVLIFGFGGDGTHEFLPHNYVPDTIVYTSTHDTDTARGWWDRATDAERHFAGSYLACDAHSFHWAAIRACMNSVSRLAVFPLQDVIGLPTEHRMNLPGTLTPLNWSWRFEWPMLADEHARVLALMTATSGRDGAAPKPTQPVAGYLPL